MADKVAREPSACQAIDFARMQISEVLICLVVAVADGDTLTARCGEPGAYEQVKVRISGIDAPEKAQAFGQRSKQALSGLCFQETATIRPTTRDKYGRTVADVECQGQDVSTSQVKTGMAWVFDRYSYGYEHLYPLQDVAREAALGLWSDTSAVPPWEWRSRELSKKKNTR